MGKPELFGQIMECGNLYGKMNLKVINFPENDGEKFPDNV
jgi:hypothetical protein